MVFIPSDYSLAGTPDRRGRRLIVSSEDTGNVVNEIAQVSKEAVMGF